jgi:SAM-dependent methyltransferase
MTAPTERFRDRVDDYDRWRPGYPPALLDVLGGKAGLRPEHVVADVGSGTGILSRLFLANGNVVYGVEPNAAMAERAERVLAGTAFRSVRGRAEQTGLPAACVDFIAVGQAFHWFDPAASAAEMRRIARPGAYAAIVWNLRRLSGTPFLVAYEAFLQRWGTDYQAVSERYADGEALDAFFGGMRYERHRFENAQDFDREGLRGRLLSSSYTPGPDDPNRGPMLEALAALHAEHAVAGRVRFEYDTELFLGRLQE